MKELEQVTPNFILGTLAVIASVLIAASVLRQLGETADTAMRAQCVALYTAAVQARATDSATHRTALQRATRGQPVEAIANAPQCRDYFKEF